MHYDCALLSHVVGACALHENIRSHDTSRELLCEDAHLLIRTRALVLLRKTLIKFMSTAVHGPSALFSECEVHVEDRDRRMSTLDFNPHCLCALQFDNKCRSLTLDDFDQALNYACTCCAMAPIEHKMESQYVPPVLKAIAT